MTQLDWGLRFGVRVEVQSGPGVGMELEIWLSLSIAVGLWVALVHAWLPGQSLPV